MLFPCTFGSVFRTSILLSCINAVICANPVGNIVHARDGRSRPDDISRIIKSNHLEKFCSSWLGGTPTAITVTTTKTDVRKQQYTTVTVGKVMTVTKGVTTVTRDATATQGPGTVTAVQTSYITETVTNLSTALVVITSITPVSTNTITTTTATNTITSSVGVVTSVQTATSTVTSFTTPTTTITATFGAPTPAVTVARRHGGPENRHSPRRVPDCLEYAPDSLISAGCSLAYPAKTVTRTETAYVTPIKSTQTSTVFTSTTTVPGKIQTITSTSTTTVSKPTVTTTIKITSTILSTVSSSTTTITLATLTETLPATLTSTVLSTSTFLTTTTVTTTATSTAPEATYTSCPGQNRVPGAFGIGVNAGSGTIDVRNTATANECCLQCYDPAQSMRCSAWVYSAPSFCGIITNAAGPTGASTTCPNGLGDYFFILGGDPGNEVGGSGPCAGNML